METMNARYKAKTNKTGSRIDMENPELPIELSQMIIWVMHHEDDAMHLLPEYNKIRQQAEERDEGSAKSAAMICETCKYQHTSEDVYVWPCKHCTPDDRRYEKAQAHYPEEWGPSDNRRLTCVCGDPDPFHATKTPNAALTGATPNGGASELSDVLGAKSRRWRYGKRKGRNESFDSLRVQRKDTEGV